MEETMTEQVLRLQKTIKGLQEKAEKVLGSKGIVTESEPTCTVSEGVIREGTQEKKVKIINNSIYDIVQEGHGKKAIYYPRTGKDREGNWLY